MARKLLIAANWKMNPPPAYAMADRSPYRLRTDVDIVVFPTFLELVPCIAARIITGGQYGRPEACGAFTGDISMKMLKNIGCHYVLCGHSERRENHKETNEDVAAQAIAALEVGLHPIVCIGEKREEREAGQEKDIVSKQLKVFPLHSDLTIAYEPVWAIGTGKNATPDQIQEMHAFIRSLLPDDKKETMRILYGGSVKPENARGILASSDVDGALVGGASLDLEQFGKIVEAARPNL